MSNKLFDQVGGIITVSLKGKNQEKIINMALARGIYIWEMKKAADHMSLKVRTSGFEALKNIAQENGYELEVIGQEGLPFVKGIAKRRIGFICGGLIFVLALYIMSSFIWFIEVSGNKMVDRNRIIVTAAGHGIYPGAAKWNFSRTAVEEAILRDISELAYVKLDIRGVRLNIQVVEKVLPRDEITGPCHMIASKDGIVKDILILEGQANVAEGDVVARGDILISGVVFPEKSPYLISENEEETEPQPYTVRARGTVKATVWYEGYGECRLKTVDTILSGRQASIVYVETPWRNIMLKGSRETGFSSAQQKIQKKIVNTSLGQFGIYRITLEEQKTRTRVYSEKQAIETARQRAIKSLYSDMGRQQKITSSEVEVLSAPSDPILRIKVSAEMVENIAVAEPINTGEQ